MGGREEVREEDRLQHLLRFKPYWGEVTGLRTQELAWIQRYTLHKNVSPARFTAALKL